MRARQSNVVGGRTVVHKVKLTPEQKVALQARAEDRGVTVSRLMVESSLADRQGFASRRELVDLFAMSNALSALSNNMNQIAKVANGSGSVPADLVHTLDAVRRLVWRLDDVSRAITGRAVKESEL